MTPDLGVMQGFNPSLRLLIAVRRDAAAIHCAKLGVSPLRSTSVHSTRDLERFTDLHGTMLDRENVNCLIVDNERCRVE